MSHECLISIEYIDEFRQILENNQRSAEKDSPQDIMIQMQIDTVDTLRDYINIKSKARTAYILNKLVIKEIGNEL